MLQQELGRSNQPSLKSGCSTIRTNPVNTRRLIRPATVATLSTVFSHKDLHYEKIDSLARKMLGL